MRSIHLPLLVGGCLALASLRAHGAELPMPRLLADLVPGVSTVRPSQPPWPLAAAGARMLFTVQLPDGAELWSSDGTPADGATGREPWVLDWSAASAGVAAGGGAR